MPNPAGSAGKPSHKNGVFAENKTVIGASILTHQLSPAQNVAYNF
jgi:hypothetical protein